MEVAHVIAVVKVLSKSSAHTAVNLMILRVVKHLVWKNQMMV